MQAKLVEKNCVYRAIVVGTDGSDRAREAVRQAYELSKAFGATLHLVSAGPGKSATRIDRESADAPADVQHTINPREDLDELLSGIAAEEHVAGVEVMSHAVLDTDPADAILQVAERRNADLIVLGNRGMAGVSRVLGSVPNKVSHHAKCSVLIVRTI
jgi:nucleotide-binding universal stress UspA family protein